MPPPSLTEQNITRNYTSFQQAHSFHLTQYSKQNKKGTTRTCRIERDGIIRCPGYLFTDASLKKEDKQYYGDTLETRAQMSTER